jgi:hypothetical protein
MLQDDRDNLATVAQPAEVTISGLQSTSSGLAVDVHVKNLAATNCRAPILRAAPGSTWWSRTWAEIILRSA